MSSIIIRPLEKEEIPSVFYDLVASYAFEPSPPLPDRAEREAILRERQEETFIALFEDGVPLSCAAAVPMTQQIRGKRFSMGGIWGVSTDPRGRRQGYSKEVISHILKTLYQAGMPFSCLHPFREGFYERLGYATFPLPMCASFATAALLPLVDDTMPGKVERGLVGEDMATYRGYLRELQRQVHGMALFDDESRDRKLRDHYWMAVARVEGRLAGLMLYKLEGEHLTGFTFHAFHFSYLNRAGRALLLDWIARHDGQASRAMIHLPRYERPETWLSDLQIRLKSEVRAPMGRIVDVTGIDGMQVGPSSFTARVSDPLCPWNEGVWRFESAGGKLQVVPARTAGCELTIQGLSALVYGTHDPADLNARSWSNASLTQQEEMRLIFPALLPHLNQFF